MYRKIETRQINKWIKHLSTINKMHTYLNYEPISENYEMIEFFRSMVKENKNLIS